MRRPLPLAAVLAIAAALFVVFGRRAPDPPSDPAPAVSAAATDSVWYHASDVALLASTGRPQLVGFFHPG